MADEEVVPTQESMFPDLAPPVPMMPVPRAFGLTPAWSWITAPVGNGWHLIRRSRGNDKVITICGINGRKGKRAPATMEAPCAECLAFATGNSETPAP